MLLNGIPLALKKISGGRIVPHDSEIAEEWVIPPGGITPPFVYVSSFPELNSV
jgi:AGZA family xanthine/uracil permease-like MFS transporter